MKVHNFAWIVSATMAAASAYGVVANAPTGGGAKVMFSREELALRLSFTHLKKEMIERDIHSEVARLRMAEWFEQHGAEIAALGEVAKARRDARPLAEVKLPTVIPSAEESEPEEFVAAGREYFAQASAALLRGTKTADEAFAARARLADFMEAPSSRMLQRQMQLADEELAKRDSEQLDTAPLGEEEIVELPARERIFAEIDMRLDELISREFREGEYYRDRLVKQEDYLNRKHRELGESLGVKMGRQERMDRINADILALEEQLNRIGDSNEN